MANGAEVARAFVTIVPTMQGAQAEITKELTGITDQAAKEAGSSGGSNFGGSFSDALKGTAAVITGTLVAVTTAAVAAATSAGKAFINAAKDTAAYGDEVDKTSQRLGVSRQAYQELDYVLNLAGTSMSNTSAGFRTLTNQIDDAINGSAEAQGRFEALGISLDDLNSMSREDVFLAVVNGFQNMGDTAERAALANDVFGRSGQQLAPLFNMTAEATREAIETANEYGMVLSDEGVAASAQFTDSMTTMERTTQGLKNQMMANFLPAMSSIMDGISQIFSGDKAGADLIKSGIEELIGKISTYAPTFFSLAQTIVFALLDGFGPMMPEAVTAIFSFLNQALVQITSMMPQLMPVITAGIQGLMSAVFQCMPIIISSLVQIMVGVIEWLTSGDNITVLTNGVIQLVASLAEGVGDIVNALLPAIVLIMSQVAQALVQPQNMQIIFDSILYLIGAIVVGLSKWLVNVIDTVVLFLGKIVSNIKSTWTTILSNIGNFFTNLGSKLSGWLNNIKTSFANGFEYVKNKIKSIFDKVKELATGVFDKIKELPNKVVSIGKNLITGLWNGISDKISWIKSKISGMATTITNAIKGVFGIHSPSKLWKDEIGSNLALGIGEGFTDEMSSVKSDMVNSMNGLTYSMTGEVSAYGTGNAGMLSSGSTYNGSPVTINVYGAEGQDVNSLAETIAQKLEAMTRRKEIVYA